MFNEQYVEIEIPYDGGLNSLLSIVCKLSKETNQVIGIRDADFLHLEENIETPENIFLTDFHDAEMMMISYDRPYHEVVREYLGKEKDPQLLSREKILNSIAFIGGLKWINSSDDLNLKFDGLGLGEFYDKQTFMLDEKRFLQAIMKRSNNKKRVVLENEILAKIENISDFLNICNGHDFQKIFAFRINSFRKKGVSEEEMSRSFRLAYTIEDFQKTNLYQKLQIWSDKHSKIFFN